VGRIEQHTDLFAGTREGQQSLVSEYIPWSEKEGNCVLGRKSASEAHDVSCRWVVRVMSMQIVHQCPLDTGMGSAAPRQS